jgi:5,10-methylenetetrahydromethanopterin reductase
LAGYNAVDSPGKEQMALKLDLRVPPCAPVTEVAAFVRQCEEAGFDGVGLLDSQMLERDVFVSMALSLQATSRIRVASAVTNPVTRHVSVLASAAKTVAELAPHRVEFWLGRGYSCVQTIGVKPASVRQMRESVLTLKQLLAGQEVSFNGVTSRMRHGDAAKVPIYISATGPRAIELAGEVADGVVLQIGLHPTAVEIARQHLAAGAERAGRNPDDVELILTATTIVHDDQQEAREMARPLCVQRLMEESHAKWLRETSIGAEGLELPKELWELYPDVPHAEDWEKAKSLCAFLPDDLLAQLCDFIGLIGTPEYCARRLKELEASGIGHIYLMTGATYEFAHSELRAFKEAVFPALDAKA